MSRKPFTPYPSYIPGDGDEPHVELSRDNPLNHGPDSDGSAEAASEDDRPKHDSGDSSDQA